MGAGLCFASASPSGQNWSGAGFQSTYEIDSEVGLVGVFYDPINGVYADPTTVTVSVLTPGNTKTTYTYPTTGFTKISTGRYLYTFEPEASGVWTYKFQGVGGVIATSPDCTFTVNASQLIAG